MKNIFKFIISVLICGMAGAAAAIFANPVIGGWYESLIKPSFTPSGYVIGLVWDVLFVLMGISLYLVWSKNWEIKLTYQDKKRKIWNRVSEKLFLGSWREENAVLIFIIQLGFNILWPFVFFSLEFPGLAFFELLMLWVAIAYTIANFYRISKLASYLLVPYIIWVTFAGILNYQIWMLN